MSNRIDRNLVETDCSFSSTENFAEKLNEVTSATECYFTTPPMGQNTPERCLEKFFQIKTFPAELQRLCKLRKVLI